LPTSLRSPIGLYFELSLKPELFETNVFDGLSSRCIDNRYATVETYQEPRTIVRDSYGCKTE